MDQLASTMETLTGDSHGPRSLAMMSEIVTTVWNKMCDTMEALAANSSLVGSVQCCFNSEQGMELRNLIMVMSPDHVIANLSWLFPKLVLELKVLFSGAGVWPMHAVMRTCKRSELAMQESSAQHMFV
jgi:hypothetical protein